MLAGFYSELLRVLRAGPVVSGGAGLEGAAAADEAG